MCFNQLISNKVKRFNNKTLFTFINKFNINKITYVPFYRFLSKLYTINVVALKKMIDF